MGNTKIGLGLAALGRPEYINIRTDTHFDRSKSAFKTNAYNMLDFAYENGVRFFDTAPSYGLGEQFLLDWKTTRAYNDILISTKWGYTYVANWELGFHGKHEIKEHSLSKLNEQWMVSKALLPQLGIYQVHSATMESGIITDRAIHERLFQLKKKYNIQIGISTSGPNQSKIINHAKYIKVANEILFDSYQVTYNIFEQSTFDALQDLKSKGKTIIIKEALANGRIFPKKQLNDTLEKLQTTYHTGRDALALRFIIDTLEPDYLLSGASSNIQLDQNLKALDFKLSLDDLQGLTALKRDTTTYWSERADLVWN